MPYFSWENDSGRKKKLKLSNFSSNMEEMRLGCHNREFSKINNTTKKENNDSNTRTTTIKVNDSAENTVYVNNSLTPINGTSFSDSPNQQCIQQPKRQKNMFYIRILRAICQNLDNKMCIQQMKDLNSNKKRRHFKDSLNSKVAIGDGSLDKSKKHKDKLENCLSAISNINKTCTTCSPKDITEFVGFLGLSELISREKTRSSKDVIPTPKFEIIEKNRNKDLSILKKKPPAFIETVLKVLKMKTHPELSSLIKLHLKPGISKSIREKIRQIAVRTKSKILHRENRMVDLLKPKDVNTANNMIITESNCLNEKSPHLKNSNESKNNFDFKEKITDENKESVNPNKIQITSENSTISVEKVSEHIKRNIKHIDSPKTPKKIIDLRSIKRSSSQKLDYEKNCRSISTDKIFIGRNINGMASKLSSLSSGTLSGYPKSKCDSLTSSDPRSIYNTNLTRTKYLQRGCSEPTEGVLAGSKHSIIIKPLLSNKRKSESDLENGRDHSLPKRMCLDLDEICFANNVILRSTPCSKVFNNVLEDRMKDSQKRVLEMYCYKKENDVKQELKKHEKCLSFLELKQHYELKNFYEKSINCPINKRIELEIEHRLQTRRLKDHLHEQLSRLDRDFQYLFNVLLSRQNRDLVDLHTVFMKNSLQSDYLTILLRKGPTRENKFTICYQQVTAPPNVIVTLLREDEVYDSFYSHKVLEDGF